MSIIVEAGDTSLAALKDQFNPQLREVIESLVDARSEPVAGFSAAT